MTHLVIESTLGVEELEELHVSLTSPEVEVSNFEVTPDWIERYYQKIQQICANTYSGNDYTCCLRHRR